MNLLEKDLKLLLDTLADRCTTETMRSVMDTMKQSKLSRAHEGPFYRNAVQCHGI